MPIDGKKRKRVLRTIVAFSSNVVNKGRNVVRPLTIDNIVGDNDRAL